LRKTQICFLLYAWWIFAGKRFVLAARRLDGCGDDMHRLHGLTRALPIACAHGRALRTGPILALASAVCLAAFAPAALAQQRAVDHHGNWVVNFGKPAASPAAPRSERSRQSRRSRSSEKKAVAKRPKPALVKFVDETGRRYNPSSNVWFDGKSACWSGAEPFTYKDGAWHYGKAAWTEVGTGWATTTAASCSWRPCRS
jgi:hypothetical protein